MERKAEIRAGENGRTRMGRIVGEGMYIHLRGIEIPEDFIIYAIDTGGMKHAVKPAQDYQEARDLVRRLNALDQE